MRSEEPAMRSLRKLVYRNFVRWAKYLRHQPSSPIRRFSNEAW
ncbi:hypothetical protein I553_0086 [Mycobacterium xenopi 4042]|uniref:Uncharacterized protein n=1 Tax=Mycobacterium xenopi 4042 TaxID=1299334 RepID=X7YJA2_MYCXE|nr:hypothetical protein I553_0086 [Mycobacterium xenopi 4042]